MSAAIVLHGLFMLVCYHKTQTCDVVAPHTPMTGHTGDVHSYLWGVGIGSQFSISWDCLPVQKDLTKKMSIGIGELTAASAHPFERKYPDGGAYEDHQFVLDETKLKLTQPFDPAAARNVISVPWPNRILGADRVSVKSGMVAKVSSQKSWIKSLEDTSDEYLFSETTILYYAAGPAFTFADENGAKIGNSTIGNGISIMILSSWPPGGMWADHSAGMNNLVQDSTGAHPSFQFTGIPQTFSSGNESEADDLGLPSSVIAHSRLPQGKLLTRGAGGKMRPNAGHRYMLTGTETGCGSTSLDGGDGGGG